MEPTLRPGDRLYVERLAGSSRGLRRGDVVVLRDPEGSGRWLIKRVRATAEDPSAVAPQDVPSGTVFVAGDNPGSSRDSRSFGVVPIDSVVGVVELRYWPMDRRGRLPAP